MIFLFVCVDETLRLILLHPTDPCSPICSSLLAPSPLLPFSQHPRLLRHPRRLLSNHDQVLLPQTAHLKAVHVVCYCPPTRGQLQRQIFGERGRTPPLSLAPPPTPVVRRTNRRPGMRRGSAWCGRALMRPRRALPACDFNVATIQQCLGRGGTGRRRGGWVG